MGQKSAAYDANGKITAFYDSVDSPVPNGVSAIDITDQEWQQALSTHGYTVANGALLPPPAPSAAQILAGAQQAQIALLQNAYAQAINAPVSFTNAAGVTRLYPAMNSLTPNGRTVRENMVDVLNAGAGAWALGRWWDVNNVPQVFTFADVQGLAAAFEAVQTIDMQDLIGKIDAVMAATTVAAVQAVSF
jgi:hypothetical protein